MTSLIYNTTIKQLPVDDRPRERLQSFGSASLSNAELIAILLGGGYRNFSALNLAQQLLHEENSLPELAKCSIDALTKTKGIGLAKASSLIAAFELGRRISTTSQPTRLEVTNPDAAAALLMPKYGDRDQEHVGILALDAKNRVIKEVIVSVGILDGSMVHPREVFRPAIQANSAAVILFHNHPSGEPTPSEKDIEITKTLSEAGKAVGIELLDHLIVTRKKYISLKRDKYI